MSLSVAINSSLAEGAKKFHEGKNEGETPGDVAAHTAIETIQDQAVRREVYVEAAENIEDISMLEVHTVLDALVRVLRGEVDD